MTNLEKLNAYTIAGGRCIQLWHTLKVAQPAVHQWVLDSTTFLSNPKNFNERAYCVLHGITTEQFNPDNTPCQFLGMTAGYYRATTILAPQKVLKGRPPKLNRSKLDEYKIRNRRRNPQLYGDGLVLGHDYVICPVSQERMFLIKTNYITDTLEMTVEEYDKLYPDIQKVSQVRKDTISAGINKIDPITGKTLNQLAVDKAMKTMKAVGEDGLTIHQKLGKKTKDAHMKNVDAQGRNGYQRQAHLRVTTMQANGKTVEQNAHEKRNDTIIKTYGSRKYGGASKLSKKELAPILEFLNVNEIAYYFDKTEYAIKCEETGKYYFFDLTIPSVGINIEYQSTAWHANPHWDDATWDKWTAPKGQKKSPESVLDYDYQKAKSLYNNRGIRTYFVWQSSAQLDIEYLLCLLKTLNTKS